MRKKKQEGANKSASTENAAKPEKQSKSKYYTNIRPYLDAIGAMMRAGSTMDIIAERFKVSKPTLYTYMDSHPEFFNAIKTNAEIADFSVENALYQNAISGNMVAQIFWLKNRQPKRWRDKQHVFQASSVTHKKDYEHMSDEELEHEINVLEGIVPSEVSDDVESGELH
jgi:hypothetical protein